MNKPMPESAREKRSDLISLLVVFAHTGFVVAPLFVVAATGLTWWIVLLWLWFGASMNGLLNLMHECSHYHVFKAKLGSDLLGHWILGPLSLTDFDDYRKRHWDHHRNLGADDDPKYAYRVDLRGVRFALVLVKCLLGVEALRKFVFQLKNKSSTSIDGGVKSYRWLLRAFLFHVALASVLFVVAQYHNPWMGSVEVGGRVAMTIGVYAYGLSSLTVFFATLRAIAEHQIDSSKAAYRGQAALRNFTCSIPTWLLMGAYGFSDHATHHERPAIPYYRLGEVTRELSIGDRSFEPVYSYPATLVGIVFHRSSEVQGL